MRPVALGIHDLDVGASWPPIHSRYPGSSGCKSRSPRVDCPLQFGLGQKSELKRSRYRGLAATSMLQVEAHVSAVVWPVVALSLSLAALSDAGADQICKRRAYEQDEVLADGCACPIVPASDGWKLSPGGRRGAPGGPGVRGEQERPARYVRDTANIRSVWGVSHTDRNDTICKRASTTQAFSHNPLRSALTLLHALDWESMVTWALSDVARSAGSLRTTPMTVSS